MVEPRSLCILQLMKVTWGLDAAYTTRFPPPPACEKPNLNLARTKCLPKPGPNLRERDKIRVWDGGGVRPCPPRGLGLLRSRGGTARPRPPVGTHLPGSSWRTRKALSSICNPPISSKSPTFSFVRVWLRLSGFPSPPPPPASSRPVGLSGKSLKKSTKIRPESKKKNPGKL